MADVSQKSGKYGLNWLHLDLKFKEADFEGQKSLELICRTEGLNNISRVPWHQLAKSYFRARVRYCY